MVAEANGKSPTILVVDDDREIVRAIAINLEREGYSVLCAYDGTEALELIAENDVKLIILDIMMPRLDGLSVLMKMREGNNIPVILLSAKSEDTDKILGLSIGADDYVTKPFNSEELGLRIEAILKRCGLTKEEEIYNIGIYTFDAINMRLISPDGQQTLTPKENNILRLLCQNQNQLLSREKALKEIWGDENYFVRRSMDVFIARIRKYLKNDPKVSIVTIHGTGFQLEVAE